MNILTSGKKNSGRLPWLMREVFSVIVWAFFVIKLFIFDIDVYLVNAISPKLGFVVKYRFLVFLILIVLIWNRLGNRRFLKLLAYIFSYPFVFLFWRIPLLLLRSKSWVIAMGYLSAVISFLKSMRVNLTIFTALSISVVLILTIELKHILIPSMLVLGIYLGWHYVKRFIDSFKTGEVLGIDTSALEQFSLGFQHQYTEFKQIGTSNKEDMTEEEYKVYIDKLQQILLFDKLWYFVASRLRDFKKSRAFILFSFVKLVYTLFITMCVFDLLNYAVYKMDYNSFQTPSGFKGFVSFIYYSFNTIFTNNVIDFYPVSIFARLLNSAEILFGFLILVILFFLITNVVRERHTEELDRMTELARARGQELDKLIHSKFNLTVEEAIQEVEKIKGSMLKMIYYFASQIDS